MFGCIKHVKSTAPPGPVFGGTPGWRLEASQIAEASGWPDGSPQVVVFDHGDVPRVR